MPKKMLYVLVFKMGELNYYVQNYFGSYGLSGLQNNAIKYYSKEVAEKNIHPMEARVGRKLSVQQIEVNE